MSSEVPGGRPLWPSVFYLSDPQPVCYALPETHDPEAVAEALGVSTETVLLWIKSGELKASSMSRDPLSQKPRWRVAEFDVQTFWDSRQNRKPVEKPSRKKRAKPKRKHLKY